MKRFAENKAAIELLTPKETNSDLILMWEKLYPISLGNATSYKRRLRELYTWSKPQGTIRTNNYKWREWACKIQALKGLILEEYPNSIFTSDHKTILKK